MESVVTSVDDSTLLDNAAGTTQRHCSRSRPSCASEPVLEKWTASDRARQRHVYHRDR